MREWFAHPKPLPSREDQVAWRAAVREVAALVGDRIPDRLPGSNSFSCVTCDEPTLEHECSLCAADRECWPSVRT